MVLYAQFEKKQIGPFGGQKLSRLWGRGGGDLHTRLSGKKVNILLNITGTILEKNHFWIVPGSKTLCRLSGGGESSSIYPMDIIGIRV